MRIIYAGSPDFAVPALQALLDSEHEVVAAYTQPDRPAGRGRKLTPPPVKVLAEEHAIPVKQPLSLKDDDVQAELAGMAPDCMVVVAYGLLLPQAVLDIPKYGCVNLHASLLPKHRGAAPVQAAILAGDAHTGVCLMQMEAGLDTGPVLLKSVTDIGSFETTGQLTERLADIGGDVLLEGLKKMPDGGLTPEPQNDAEASYAGKIVKSEATIDWTQSADEIARQVRAYNPWPVSQTLLLGGQFRIWKAIANECLIEQGAPGEVIELTPAGLAVQTGNGLLIIQEAQVPGKQRVDVAQLPNVAGLAGTVLGL